MAALVIAGPNGAGKTTLIAKLKAEFGNLVGSSVSYTTREPRAGEEDGTAYWFVDQETFDEKVSDGDFIEYATTDGNSYGTCRHSVEKMQARGMVVVLDLNVAGARSCRAAPFEGSYVFIAPPSMEELRARVEKRGGGGDIEQKMETAQKEMDGKDEAGLFDVAIVNDDVEAAYKTMQDLLTTVLEKFTAVQGIDDDYESPAQVSRTGVTAAATPGAASGEHGERPDPRRRAEEYLARNNILALFQHISATVLTERPADPKAFVLKELKKIQACQSEGMAVPSAFADADLAAMFGMFDVTRCGRITHKQMAQAMKNLGLDQASVPEDKGQRVELNDFINHARAGLDSCALRMPRPGTANAPGTGGFVALPKGRRASLIEGESLYNRSRRLSVKEAAEDESPPMTPPGKAQRTEPYYWPGKKAAAAADAEESAASPVSEPITPPGKPKRSEPYNWPGSRVASGADEVVNTEKVP